MLLVKKGSTVTCAFTNLPFPGKKLVDSPNFCVKLFLFQGSDAKKKPFLSLAPAARTLTHSSALFCPTGQDTIVLKQAASASHVYMCQSSAQQQQRGRVLTLPEKPFFHCSPWEFQQQQQGSFN